MPFLPNPILLITYILPKEGKHFTVIKEHLKF